MKPEDRARVDIDRQLAQAGWAVQDPTAVDLHAARGVAIREFPLVPGHGKADYLLYVDRKAVGAIEAKKAGTTLSAVEIQAAKYSEGLPATLPATLRPLPSLPSDRRRDAVHEPAIRIPAAVTCFTSTGPKCSRNGSAPSPCGCPRNTPSTGSPLPYASGCAISRPSRSQGCGRPSSPPCAT